MDSLTNALTWVSRFMAGLVLSLAVFVLIAEGFPIYVTLLLILSAGMLGFDLGFAYLLRKFENALKELEEEEKEEEGV